jgi:hypothetical protein
MGFQNDRYFVGQKIIVEENIRYNFRHKMFCE